MEPMGFEFTGFMEIKESCGAAWPSKSLKGKEGNLYCPRESSRRPLTLGNWVNRNAVQ